MKLSNWRSRKTRVKPEELLLLFPHCLQYNECPQNILLDHNNCKRCGRCPFSKLLGLKEKYGINMMIARGGREAVAEARKPGIKAVLSVACEKELAAGILAIASKKVRAISNSRPEGPCRNTVVDTDVVEAEIRNLLGMEAVE